MPFNTIEDQPVLPQYIPYRETPPTVEQIKEWMPLFTKYGVAQMTGLCHRGKFRGLYLNCVDFDDPNILNKLLEMYSFEQLVNAGMFIEQHYDNKGKAHIWILSNKPFPKFKSPGLEVKSDGMLVNMFPSFHKGGYRYFPVGNSLKIFDDNVEPLTNDGFINTIDKIVDGKYLNGKAKKNTTKVPINEGKLKGTGFRHNDLLDHANRVYGRDLGKVPVDVIDAEIHAYNQTRYEIPEDKAEVDQICKDVREYQLKTFNGNGEAKQESKTDQEIIKPLNITYDDWNKTLIEKYQNLKNISNENLRGLWDSLEFELSVFKILNIKDCTLPFAGILLSPPSTLKTVGLQLFRKVPNTFYTDNFSARAFVSHSTTVKKAELENIDMLPRMKNKFFLTPELSPIFGKKDEDLQETLSIITRVLDGHGYESDTGAHGHRGYAEDIMFTWVGAAVEIPYKVHKYLGTRGAKLYFFRLPLIERTDDEYMEQITNDNFDIKTKNIQDALIDYLKWFDQCPEGINIKNLIKIQWNTEKNDNKALTIIMKLAKLLSHLRAVVSTWGNTDGDFVHAFATVEDPSRAMRQLTNLARGHALSQGRNWITMEDIPIVIKAVFSTASLERVRIFELLLEHEGKLTTSVIEISLNISDDTAKRTMTELQAIGLVNDSSVQGSHGGEPQKQIELVEKFNWFLDEEFIKLRDSNSNSNSHSAEKPPCVLVNQNSDYGRSILLNSILPRTDTHIPVFMSGGKDDIDGHKDIFMSGGNPLKEEDNTPQNTITKCNKVKCPYCDHEDDPFYLKVHIKMAHEGGL